MPLNPRSALPSLAPHEGHTGPAKALGPPGPRNMGTKGLILAPVAVLRLPQPGGRQEKP